MMTQTEATIFLADQRGCSQSDWFRSYHGFNFGQYQAENREPFGSLRVFNDDVLAGDKSLKMQLDENTDVILLPLVGAIEYKNSLGETGFLEAGQVRIISAAKGMEYEVKNPYSDELINFLHIWVSGQKEYFTPKSTQNAFDFQDKNQLLPLFSTQAYGFIGKFDGREEGIYVVRNPEKNGVFVFVIEGAFEVQNRLLHPRDGLSLTHVTEIEFEALSNDAIVLILEVFI